MSLLDLVTGGKSSEASDQMEKALQAIQAVKTPTAEDLQFKIQQMVQAGVISPEQAKTYLQNPSAFQSEHIDQTGTNAQTDAIGQMQSAAKQGGLNPAEQAKISQIISQLGTAEKGANDAVVQRQAERGALTGGETMAAQMQNNQNATQNANQMALGTAGDAYSQMLNEMTTAGQLGSGLQGQQNQQGNTVAAATDEINKFNAAQQQGVENFNVGAKNDAQKGNVENLQNLENTNVTNANQHAGQMAQTHQTAYEDAMQKGEAEAGVHQTTADQDTKQGGQEAGLIGGAIGAGGQVASGFASQPKAQAAAHGGEIHSYLSGGSVGGRAKVPGDSSVNDTVPAVLSPGEVVLPRSVAHAAPDHVMEFLNRIRKPKTEIHPEDTAHMLKALTIARNEQ